MKKRLFFVLLVLWNLLCASKINYSYFLAYYKIGDDASTQRLYITDNGINEFSNQLFATLDPNTQFYFWTQSIMIGSDEGDSAVAFVYDYRYYKENEEACAWKPVKILFSSYCHPYPGAYYTSWYISQFPFLELPMDTGKYVLELAISSTVVGTAGDTLTKCYACPDGQELKGFFEVVETLEASTALELDYFEAEQVDSIIYVHWQTQSETENSHFILYRDDIVLAQESAAGSSTREQNYDYVDINPDEGWHNYRLSHVNYAGVETQCANTNICVVKYQENNMCMQVYPNPFNPRVNLSMEFKVGNNTQIKIYDTQGIMVEEVLNEYVEAGRHNIIWDASNMPSGVYIVSMRAGNTVSTQKLVLMK